MRHAHTRVEAYRVPDGYLSTAQVAELGEYTLTGITYKLCSHGCPYIRVARISTAGKRLGGHALVCWRADEAQKIAKMERNRRA